MWRRFGRVKLTGLFLAERLRAAEEAERAALADAATARAAHGEAAGNAARLERKAALLSRERDGLKAILASYDEEEAGLGVCLGFILPACMAALGCARSCITAITCLCLPPPCSTCPAMLAARNKPPKGSGCAQAAGCI